MKGSRLWTQREKLEGNAAAASSALADGDGGAREQLRMRQSQDSCPPHTHPGCYPLGLIECEPRAVHFIHGYSAGYM